MLISLNWLRELVDVTLSAEKLAETLTVAGFEVENIEDRRQLADGVVVGKVVDCQRHPDADKLSVTQVDLGKEAVSTIVCGAKNVKADIFVAVAPPKTYLPAVDLKIKTSKLRGVKSEGMICSLAELGLAKESEGIYIFAEENLTPGQDVRPLLGLDDIILDLTSTANRADALSLVGVAREVAALTGVALRLPEAVELDIPAEPTLKIEVADAQACPAYIGTVVEGVKIAPSPVWLQQRLQAAGVRPINNVVDITNYILLEWGQPLHAFDRAKLQAVAGSENIVLGTRFAGAGETLKTLDGQTRELVEQNLVIVANDKPVALAGVMGGEETEVDEGTQDIVLEAALFDPVAIRRSSRAVGLRSESSTRYERGVNQAELEFAARRAIALFVELAGGNPTARAIADARPNREDWTRSLSLRLSRVRHILGQVRREEGLDDLQAEEVEQILTALGCELERQAGEETLWTVKVPPYRYRDLEREIDLIEEVARLYGYDRFADTLPAKTEAGILPPQRKAMAQIREAFRAVGLTEVVHYSLVKPEAAEIAIANPLLSEYSALRTELLPGLLDAFEYNLARGNGALNAFEVGRVFRNLEGIASEYDAIAGIFGGDLNPQGQWVSGGKGSPMTWYEAKGLLDSVLERLGVVADYQPDSSDARCHPGRTAVLSVGGKRLGFFGQLHPQLRRDRDFPEAVYAFELSAAVLLEVMGGGNITPPRFQTYSTYPAVKRDLAFFAAKNIAVAQLEATMQKAGGELLDAVELFDVYEGENVPAGERSLAFSLAYRSRDRNLTEAEIEPAHQKVRQALEEQFGATLRS
ncbi:phenylalanine--tRNA ligase subunit beta [Oscillatoria sp. FACHB-1406]|uniref:phenylalanine--tRNA ligase subunit beta n=1 Tax=Oscillatoria sp. FACHB-1406 TaxID=2692846 RepID=UPI0016831AB8|nr:phenylalanine--tRNA ligase subunit beta [Oscillatoria sp. FACHB-1406]MBD2577169.1 phenylalanine--tRNA ligase subunit beta [Oscillatoria sp. FACHB-1406]